MAMEPTERVLPNPLARLRGNSEHCSTPDQWCFLSQTSDLYPQCADRASKCSILSDHSLFLPVLWVQPPHRARDLRGAIYPLSVLDILFCATADCLLVYPVSSHYW